ncbi:MAG TPA: hypothetical protein VJ949_02410 [Cryomorphaceae bacterium]|nr:hypothetical protein [Cryomorphaceae bacterium]
MAIILFTDNYFMTCAGDRYLTYGQAARLFLAVIRRSNLTMRKMATLDQIYPIPSLILPNEKILQLMLGFSICAYEDPCSGHFIASQFALFPV